MPIQDKSKDEMTTSQVVETMEPRSYAHGDAVSKPSDPTLAATATEPTGQPAQPVHCDSEVAGQEACPGSGSMPLSQKGSDAVAPESSLAKL